jgi:hypothetical protein
MRGGDRGPSASAGPIIGRPVGLQRHSDLAQRRRGLRRHSGLVLRLRRVKLYGQGPGRGGLLRVLRFGAATEENQAV